MRFVGPDEGNKALLQRGLPVLEVPGETLVVDRVLVHLALEPLGEDVIDLLYGLAPALDPAAAQEPDL
jgi:hypothetical protein